MTPPPANSADYLKSAFIEKLVEHVFVSEVLQEAFYRFGETAEVLRSEVDASGYDVVIECKRVLRHIQLKSSKQGGKAASQKVNMALAEKQSGCVVWVFRNEVESKDRMELKYKFFGVDARSPDFREKGQLRLDGFKVAKHTKGNAKGNKAERPAIRVVPKREFKEVKDTTELVGLLFGRMPRSL